MKYRNSILQIFIPTICFNNHNNYDYTELKFTDMLCKKKHLILNLYLYNSDKKFDVILLKGHFLKLFSIEMLHGRNRRKIAEKRENLWNNEFC